MNKHPGNIYLKEVYQYQTYRDKIKKYNRKRGNLNIFINKSNINKILLKEENNLNFDNSKENLKNNTFEHYKSKKELISNNIYKNAEKHFTKKSFLNKSNKNLANTIHTTGMGRKINILKKNYSHNKEKRINTESNINSIKKENNIQDMIDFILDKENEKTNKKLNPINYNNNKRRNSEQNNKITGILNDPNNPYSTKWANKFLKINYNFGIHYTEIEQGVPQLRLKQLKKKNLPPIYYNFTLQNDEKFFCDNSSSRSNRNIKIKPNDINYKMKNKIKKLIIEENKNNSKKNENNN